MEGVLEEDRRGSPLSQYERDRRGSPLSQYERDRRGSPLSQYERERLANMRENERLVAFAADQINLCVRSASMSKFRPRFDYDESECMRNLWK